MGQPQQFYASLTDVLAVVDIQVGEAVAPATGHSSVNSWFCNTAVRYEHYCNEVAPATLQGQV